MYVFVFKFFVLGISFSLLCNKEKEMPPKKEKPKLIHITLRVKRLNESCRPLVCTLTLAKWRSVGVNEIKWRVFFSEPERASLLATSILSCNCRLLWLLRASFFFVLFSFNLTLMTVVIFYQPFIYPSYLARNKKEKYIQKILCKKEKS